MPSSQIVHRFTFSFREAIAALLVDDQVNAESYDVRVVNNVLVLDIINPAVREKEPEEEAQVETSSAQEDERVHAGSDVPTEEPAADEQPIEEAEEPTTKLKGGPLAARAGIICNEKAFAIFMDATTPEQAADELRTACGIRSRAELDHSEAAAKEFKRIDRDYQVWLRAEDGQ